MRLEKDTPKILTLGAQKPEPLEVLSFTLLSNAVVWGIKQQYQKRLLNSDLNLT